MGASFDPARGKLIILERRDGKQEGADAPRPNVLMALSCVETSRFEGEAPDLMSYACCSTCECVLIDGRDAGASKEQAGETEPAERKGVVALDFRNIASIHGFDPYL